jgi:hypothetical protein
MTYSSQSIVINLSKQETWDFLQKAIKNLDKYSEEIDSIEVIEEYYDGLLREVVTESEKFLERVFIVKDQLKIVIKLVEHNVYQGETIFQIVTSDDDFLSDKKVTLTAVLSWRIHPGLIEAPILNKDDYISQLLENINKESNVSLI